MQSCKVAGLGFRQQKVTIGSMVKNTNYFQMLRPNSEFSVGLRFSLYHCQNILDLANTRTPMSTLSVSFCLTLLPTTSKNICNFFLFTLIIGLVNNLIPCYLLALQQEVHIIFFYSLHVVMPFKN